MAPHHRKIDLGGYILIPHELLHLLGFWLAGTRCEYRWGQPYVRPLEPMSRRQRLVGRLFPFVIFTLLVLGCALLVPLAYVNALRGGSWLCLILCLALLQIAILYAGTTLVDVRNAYLLIVDKPWHSRTPFDMFLWPFVDWDEVRRARESDVE